MSRLAPIIVCLALSATSAVTWAKERVIKQGQACVEGDACDGRLKCLRGPSGRSTCELPCADNAKCPEDQRCVKDGPRRICRPIEDGLGL